jgi:protein-S-isoprenylcysteine O-methyltransferase Ste14
MALQQAMVAQGNFLFRHRGTAPILILIPALLLRFYGTPDEWIATSQSTITLIAYAIAMTGLLLRFIVVGYAPLRTSGRNTQEQIADSLSQTGMYSIVRHPLYLGNALMWLGPAMLTFQSYFIGIFILLYWLYYERIMLAEEDYLRGKFGEAYENWAKGRPAFIPDFIKWVPYQQPFRFFKALYQEKTGFLWLNLLFWIFNALPAQSMNEALEKSTLWSGLLAFSLLLYVFLKVTRIGKVTI